MAPQSPAVESRRALPDTPLSYTEFLDWADEDIYAEWVDGNIVIMSPASRRHQQITDFLVKIVGTYVEEHDLGLLLSAPFQMKLDNGREPDVLFVRDEHLDRLQETYLDGAADLVVEVVSPESVGRDRGDKLYEYARGGVPEYWLIDPQMQWMEVYHLEGQRYRPAFSGEEGSFHSEAMDGFWLEVAWLWQDPPPRLLEVLKEYGLV